MFERESNDPIAVRPGKVKGKPNLKMTSLANEQKRHAERNLSSPIPPVHGFNSQYTNGNHSGANNGSNEISTVPNGRHSYPKTDFEISIYNPKEKDVGRQGTPCEKNVTNNAHHNEVVIEYNFCTCNDKIDSSRCSSCNDTPCSPSGSAGTLNREQARNQRNRNNISVNGNIKIGNNTNNEKGHRSGDLTIIVTLIIIIIIAVRKTTRVTPMGGRITRTIIAILNVTTATTLVGEIWD